MEKRWLTYIRRLLLSSSWIRHGAFWLFVVIIEIISTSYLFLMNPIKQLEYLIGFLVVQVVFSYTAYGIYVFANRLNSIVLFSIMLLGVAYVNALVSSWWQLCMYPESPVASRVMNFYPASLLFMIFFISLKFAKDLYVWQQAEFAQKQEQNEAELDFLKAQISPHFLFNTLNNLYGYAVTKSDLLPDMMLRLSDFLRYSLYDVNKSFVPLSDELEYLKNYILLERLRISDNSNVTFTIPENVDLKIQIAPLILITFIENAFKHSRHTINSELYINGKLYVNGNMLTMEIENSYNPSLSKENITKEASGVGLKNTYKRLLLVYPNKYTLVTDKQDNIYKLKLTLEL